jgi:hypothetical protein
MTTLLISSAWTSRQAGQSGKESSAVGPDQPAGAHHSLCCELVVIHCVTSACTDGLSAGLRRTVAFYPSNLPPSEINVTVVITNVSVEFTKLGSFGNVATFAGNLVNSLDRSYLLKVSAGCCAGYAFPTQ